MKKLNLAGRKWGELTHEEKRNLKNHGILSRDDQIRSRRASNNC